MVRFIHVTYDDRERFPWMLWAGDELHAKYRTREAAIDAASKLRQIITNAKMEGEHE